MSSVKKEIWKRNAGQRSQPKGQGPDWCLHETQQHGDRINKSRHRKRKKDEVYSKGSCDDGWVQKPKNGTKQKLYLVTF